MDSATSDERMTDEQLMQRAKDKITLGALQGLPTTMCPVCRGEGTFDRLWPGNQEVCYYCAGLKVVLADGSYVDDPDTNLRWLQFATYRSGKSLVKRKRYNG